MTTPPLSHDSPLLSRDSSLLSRDSPLSLGMDGKIEKIFDTEITPELTVEAALELKQAPKHSQSHEKKECYDQEMESKLKETTIQLKENLVIVTKLDAIKRASKKKSDTYDIEQNERQAIEEKMRNMESKLESDLKQVAAKFEKKIAVVKKETADRTYLIEKKKDQDIEKVHQQAAKHRSTGTIPKCASKNKFGNSHRMKGGKSGPILVKDEEFGKAVVRMNLELVRAWEEYKISKIENRASTMKSASMSEMSVKIQALLAESKRAQGELEMVKENHKEQMKNKIAEIHRVAVEKAAYIEMEKDGIIRDAEDCCEKSDLLGLLSLQFNH